MPRGYSFKSGGTLSACGPERAIVVELARALTGNAQLLMSRVVTTRATADSPAMAVLGAGINIASIMRHERHQIFFANRPVTDRLQC